MEAGYVLGAMVDFVLRVAVYFGFIGSGSLAVDKDFDPLMGMPKMTGFCVKFSSIN
ncbi:hypothetical protein LCGC14_2849110 [marine sediment metagenome]|uniref:Uncharacterized protein n=1 Tax=marine sediment metagenome TaxID=412755 RepID=A0A0F9AHA8_9ZZZZ